MSHSGKCWSIGGNDTYAELPRLDPWPGSDVSNAVLALAISGEVIALLACILAGEVDLEDAVDTQCLIAKSINGV